MVMKPSAPLNAVTEPDPLPIGYAARPPAPRTRPTSRYSVRPRSEFTRIGSIADTVCRRSRGTPAYARVARAFRRAAREHDDIVLERALERGGESRVAVGDDPELHGFAAELFDGRADDRGVGVVN